MENYIRFLDKINNDNFNISDLTIANYEYLDTYVFEDYSNELTEKLYKMFDKYILHFDANKEVFSGLGYLPEKMHIYILEKYGMLMNDCIGLYIRLADGPESIVYIIELLVKNNIIINITSIKNNIDEIKECIKDGNFDISNKDIELYLENYKL